MTPVVEQMTAEERIEYYRERKASRDVDGRPKVSDTARSWDDDPLLEALYREHKFPRRDLFNSG